MEGKTVSEYFFPPCSLGFAIKRHPDLPISGHARPTPPGLPRFIPTPAVHGSLTGPLTVRPCPSLCRCHSASVPHTPPPPPWPSLPSPVPSALGKTSTPRDAYQRPFTFLLSCEAFALALAFGLLLLMFYDSATPDSRRSFISFWPGL